MSWRIYYGDDSTYDGEGMQKPPSRDVQAIVQDHPYVGAEIITASDYYVWDDNMGRWRGVDIFGLFDFLLDSGIVVFGRTIRKEEYEEIIRKAVQYKEKNGWTTLERRSIEQ